jgi:hypothetical protein
MLERMMCRLGVSSLHAADTGVEPNELVVVVLVHYGCNNVPPADVVILNLDRALTLVSYIECIEAVKEHTRVINGNVMDLSRRAVSQLLVTAESLWHGPVIVETNARLGGRAEQARRVIAQLRGLTTDIAPAPILAEYPVFRNVSEVPESVWASPHFIVEKFIPQLGPLGFYTYSWTFFGGSERCNRFVGREPAVKARNVRGFEPVAVPEDIRAERERFRLDFGRIDYLVCEDACIVFDVHRSPSAPDGDQGPADVAGNAALAVGLRGWL